MIRDPFFKIAHKKVNGEWLTKSQYLNYEHRKEAKQILKADKEFEKVKKRIREMKDGPHSHSIPYELRQKPSRKELEVGIPECCNREPMIVSAFVEGMWFCPSCKSTRLR